MFKTFVEAEKFMQSRQQLGIKPGLQRIRLLLKLLDNPQDKIRAIHVAGTNGKGSTVSFIKNALIANGFQVGLFTSPSFEGLTGYIFRNNQSITEEIFLELLNEIYPHIVQLDRNNMQPTEFEIISVIAFVYFAKFVDFALIEAGMGGREDTTNCFTPILSIITNVDKDHTAFLGNTIDEIAYHKAGIIKQNTPVIVGEVKEAAYAVIQQEATGQCAPMYKLSHDFSYANIRMKDNRQQFIWKTEQVFLQPILKMSGVHQVKNASLAMMALHLMMKTGYKLDWDRCLAAIGHTQIPGRFEVIRLNPTIILDGAHNPAGIDAFLQTVSSIYYGQKKHLIFAGFKDKDLQAMIRKCIPYFDTVCLTSFEHPRAASSQSLVNEIPLKNVEVIDSWKDVLRKIKFEQEARELYFFAGSLHFISLVRTYFLQNNQLE